MIVKVAPLGDRVVEVNVEPNTTVGQALEIAGTLHNGRAIRLSNTEATLSTPITAENSIITLATRMKGGR